MQNLENLNNKHSSQKTETTTTAESKSLTIIYAILGVFLIIGIAINLSNVFNRYILNSAIFWAEEVLVGMSIWGVFIGAAVVSWRGDHLNMDLFSSKISGKPKIILNFLVALTAIAICAFVAIQSWTILSLFIETKAVSAGAEIPKFIPHSSLFFGFGISAIVITLRLKSWINGNYGGNG
jgi:TRAP-type transport system small permease protein